MTTSLQIDFVSDIACPWCAVGLGGLEQALDKLLGQVDAHISFQPFELNPAMGPEGQDMTEHLTQKYGSSAEQQAQIRETIRARGAEVGFSFKPEGRGRIWNTFDAHRLLHWAGELGPDRQYALKKELLAAYHGRAENVSDAEVLLRACRTVGLDEARAREILGGDEYALVVRQNELQWQQAGISSVPAVIVNGRYLISGGQPAAAYEQALRRIAAEAAAPDPA
ncbi:DsbA family oxidoreductase [Bradyrhizobium sp.]|uniref:DsbA family oxidoreductase n=1 Tax=Bradyrhizobium sp. TaxID=376 RepID=UPI0027327412|nr:DsbA family oxidoreductase [Bradyrhizobium sp.]MDP3690576.1 DsbA family oxidoreductase [Bradyrhizobium sp.]